MPFLSKCFLFLPHFRARHSHLQDSIRSMHCLHGPVLRRTLQGKRMPPATQGFGPWSSAAHLWAWGLIPSPSASNRLSRPQSSLLPPKPPATQESCRQRTKSLVLPSRNQATARLAQCVLLRRNQNTPSSFLAVAPFLYGPFGWRHRLTCVHWNGCRTGASFCGTFGSSFPVVSWVPLPVLQGLTL